jgi:hypothetical protein
LHLKQGLYLGDTKLRYENFNCIQRWQKYAEIDILIIVEYKLGHHFWWGFWKYISSSLKYA